MKNRFKKIRKDYSMTQQNFADSLNLSRNFVAQIEMGSKIPSERTIKDICREFNINEDWLRYGSGEMHSVTLSDEHNNILKEIGALDSRAQKIILNYWRLSEQEKNLLWKVLDKLTNDMED